MPPRMQDRAFSTFVRSLLIVAANQYSCKLRRTGSPPRALNLRGRACAH